MPTSELPIATRCPSCQGDTRVLGHAVIAPFVTSLAHLPVGSESELRQCNHCRLGYFSARYRSQDAALLYQGYRDCDYLKARRHWEPWYSRRVNEANAAKSSGLEERLGFMSQILEAAGMSDRLTCAVDFGGDEGQFFPDVPIERRVICDPSERPVASGIERIPNLHALKSASPDLVIVAHVLEHLSDPLEPLEQIREVIAPEGLLYVEVPRDQFRAHRSHGSTRYRNYLQFLSRHRGLFIPMDFMTGIWRQFRHAVPRLGIVKQSEHINYFSPDALRDLLARAGFTVAAEQDDPRAHVGGLRIGRYGVAARPQRT